MAGLKIVIPLRMRISPVNRLIHSDTELSLSHFHYAEVFSTHAAAEDAF